MIPTTQQSCCRAARGLTSSQATGRKVQGECAAVAQSKPAGSKVGGSKLAVRQQLLQDATHLTRW